MDSSQKSVTTPEVALNAITRTALGVGIGLLLARKASDQARSGAVLSLLVFGAATAIPVVIEVFDGGPARKPEAV